MDELFRRAAENYSLNTNSGDFNEVIKKLEANGNIQPVGKPANTKRRWLLLFLLIPFAWVCNNYFLPSGIHTTPDNVANTSLSNNTIDQVIAPGQAPANASIQASINRIPSSIGNNIRSGSILSSTSDDKRGQPVKEQILPLSSIITQAGEQGDEPIKSGEKTDDIIIKPASPNAEQLQIKTTENTPDNKTNPVQSKEKQKKQLTRQGLYAGIIISPDISMVRFQPVKNIGIGFGLLAGYKFSKRIGIESGVTWDKKYYYSDGEYVDREHAYLPADAKIISMSGNCSMIEIPLNIRYDFKGKGSHNFSATAGISSYIMKDETYDYLVERNNRQYTKSTSYKNSSKNYMAIINFATAYNLSIGNGNTFRVEPYVKIPLKGTGVTGVPIMSTGINLGITRRIL